MEPVFDEADVLRLYMATLHEIDVTAYVMEPHEPLGALEAWVA